MAYGITPATAGQPPAEGQRLPQFIQFRINGVDVGGPDVAVVDFVGGSISSAIDEDEDGDKLTLTFA